VVKNSTKSLRGEVRPTPAEHLACHNPPGVHTTSGPEVRNLDGAVSREQEIPGFHVAMHESRRECCPKTANGIARDPENLGWWQRSTPCEFVFETAPGQVLGREERELAVRACIPQSHDIPVSDLQQRDRLGVELLGRFGLLGDLHDNGATQTRVYRPVNRPVRTRAEQTLDHRTADHLPRFQGQRLILGSLGACSAH